MSDELTEVRELLAKVLEAKQGEPDPTATDPEAPSLVEALHPGAVPRFGKADQAAFDAAIQGSADNFWTESS